MATPQELDAFVARSEIATNLARHSRGIDRNDPALLHAAYLPDAEVAYGGFTGRAADFIAIVVDSMAGQPITLHRTVPMTIAVAGDQARSESYVIAYLREPGDDGGTQRIIAGRYLDRHARSDGGWRIAHRTYVMDWNMNMASREAIAMAAGGLRGAHRAGDPAHAAFATFRAETKGDGDMTTDSAALAEAIAKQALHEVMATYARGVDRGDAALLLSAFHPEAEVRTGYIDGTAAEFAQGVIALGNSALQSSFHSINNEYYEVSGDRAQGETYVIAHALTAGDEPQDSLTGGRYLDRFEKRDGQWKIIEHVFVQDWNITQPSTRAENGMYEHLPTRGGRAPNDPACAFWAG